MFQAESVEKIRTLMLRAIHLSPKNGAVYEIMKETYGTARQTTDGNIVHAHCMLHN
jgi:hypothetical protein